MNWDRVDGQTNLLSNPVNRDRSRVMTEAILPMLIR